MTPQIILVLNITVIALLLFISEKVRADVAAILILIALVACNLLSPNQALLGFANPAVGIIASMFILSAGLVRTGIIDYLARGIHRIAGNTEARLILVLCLVIGGLSAFLVNTAMVAIFIPVAIVLANKRDIPASRVLIPLSFASQFGGVCTLIGTSTNVLMNSIVEEHGMAPFHLFEFAPLGLILVLVGTCYLVIIGRRLLPNRETQVQVDKYRLADYLIEFQVPEASKLIGLTWPERKVTGDSDMHLLKIIRGEKATWRASATRIRADDILLLHGNAEDLMGFKDQYKLKTVADVTLNDEEINSDQIHLVEVLVPPRSFLANRHLRSDWIARQYKAVVLAIQRRGEVLRERLEGTRVESGDTLLMQCAKEDVAELLNSPDVIVTNELTELHIRKDRAAMALGIIAVLIALVAMNIVPLLLAAIGGATLMVISRTLSIEEAYEAIDWKVIFLLGGIIPLGIAMQQTGAAAWLVETCLAPLTVHGPVFMLAIVYLFTAVFTEFMSNSATVVVLAPLAFNIAESMHVHPLPFIMAIVFASSTSFATPIGYQTNTMVYAPGGYKFSDFAKVGIPLNLLFWLISVLFIPLFWPF